ncbi:MAG TPA: Gfo/Idh/MocA family oxidoreductase [Myxococcota bacterium]|nr:Gfo/Idh/MocA family oxidoreductase [Myxococcota bacterium]
MSDRPLRIGVLGAAKIAPMALIRPAREVPEVQVVAVAARDAARAHKFAARHGIARVHKDYGALLADDAIDAIYNPLPNGLHAEWSIRALEAGKHVLCEKPIASNAAEAAQMAEAAQRTGRVLTEAFHWRYHPLAARMREAVQTEIGEVRHIEAMLCFPLPFPNDIRYSWELAGGAMMDAGCYTVNMVRWLAGAEPEVVGAEARLARPKVDRYMRADLRFPDGRTARVTASLFSARLLALKALAIGSDGEMRVLNPLAPHFFHSLKLVKRERTTRERIPGDATYTCQLRAFAEHVRGGPPMSSDARDGIANMRVIDAIYRAAGLPARGMSS